MTQSNPQDTSTILRQARMIADQASDIEKLLGAVQQLRAEVDARDKRIAELEEPKEGNREARRAVAKARKTNGAGVEASP